MTLTSDQKALLDFISGKGHHYGVGITTHKNYGPDNSWDGQKELHQACLELERLGHIKRVLDSESIVAWRPIAWKSK